MRSNVKYVGSIADCKLRHEVTALIKEHFVKYRVIGINCSIEYYYYLLLYAKYVIEKEKMDYMKIIDGEVDDLVSVLKEKFKKYFVASFVNNFVKCKLYEILKKMVFEDFEIYTYKDRVLDAYIQKDKKYLVIGNRISSGAVAYLTHRISRFRDLSYINFSNVDFYDTDIEERKQFIYELLDEITGNKRNYYTRLVDLDLDMYEGVIFLNDLDYVDCSDYVHRKCHIVNKKVFMICKYSSVSSYEGSFNDIGRVLIDNSKAYIEYPFEYILKKNKDDEHGVNLLELSNVADKDLKEVINGEKKIDKISVDINYKDFLSHGCRIGFTTYSEDNVNHERILRLVDYNNSIVHRINELDDEISKQMDKLFVR